MNPRPQNLDPFFSSKSGSSAKITYIPAKPEGLLKGLGGLLGGKKEEEK
jgi:hypothetical protein